MRNKRTTVEAVASLVTDGMTIGIGGWGARRKPMALVEALAAAPARDLTVVSYGGPDVGVLLAAKKIRKLVFGFVSLDSVPLEPRFRAARERGEVEAVELDEGMLQLGLRAAAQRVPFLPTRAGLGSDVLTWNPWLRTVRSPYDDGEELVAMPALPLDVAFVHVNRADERGNLAITGPDPYFDDLFLMAARVRVASCEAVVPSVDTVTIQRLWVDHVVEAPRGAGFTSCEPDYPRDDAALAAYVEASR